MSRPIDVSIIVVHYRDVDETRGCLDSLPDACGEAAFETLLVDNSPSQELSTPPWRGSDTAVIAMHSNAGLARATNQAIRRASGRYYLCLNPDVVANPGSIRALVSFADTHPRAGITAARLQNLDGSLQMSCRRFYTIQHVLARRTLFRLILPSRSINRDHLMEDYDHATAANVDWVLGSCMLVRAEAETEIGPMDERFFLYFEDVDWCYRMHTAGWEVLYYPGATMVHHHRRDSALRGLTHQKRSHVASFVAFHRKHGWGLLWRRPDMFRLVG